MSGWYSPFYIGSWIMSDRVEITASTGKPFVVLLDAGSKIRLTAVDQLSGHSNCCIIIQ